MGEDIYFFVGTGDGEEKANAFHAKALSKSNACNQLADSPKRRPDFCQPINCGPKATQVL